MNEERWSPALAGLGGLAGGAVAAGLAFWVAPGVIGGRFDRPDGFFDLMGSTLGALLIFGAVLAAAIVAGFVAGPTLALRIGGYRNLGATLWRIVLLDALAVPLTLKVLFDRVDSPTADWELGAGLFFVGAVVPAVARWWTNMSNRAG